MNFDRIPQTLYKEIRRALRKNDMGSLVSIHDEYKVTPEKLCCSDKEIKVKVYDIFREGIALGYLGENKLRNRYLNLFWQVEEPTLHDYKKIHHIADAQILKQVVDMLFDNGNGLTLQQIANQLDLEYHDVDYARRCTK